MSLKAFDRERQRLMITRGVPPQDFMPRRLSIDVADSMVKMEPNIPRTLPKPISAVKQYRSFETLLEHPLRTSYSVGIGSFPSDMRAKYLAQHLMSAAIDYHLKQRKGTRSLPLWHRVYGGLTDTLRDKPIQDMPCMLIISNVNAGSSNFKLEKVRDLLEKYSDIPRIVVTGGEPPCDLFANKLFAPCRYALYIGPDNRDKSI